MNAQGKALIRAKPALNTKHYTRPRIIMESSTAPRMLPSLPVAMSRTGSHKGERAFREAGQQNDGAPRKEQKNVTDQIPHAANTRQAMKDKTRRASLDS